MTEITAALVKELRERTSAGMMECKKALVKANGDIDAAAKVLREEGLAKADKKSGNIAAEGSIISRVADDKKSAVMIEGLCQTDFVARSDDFMNLLGQVADAAFKVLPETTEQLNEMSLENGITVADACRELVTKLGEKIEVRRVSSVKAKGYLGYYQHGGRIGVLVEIDADNEDLAKDLAMHIAASKPLAIKPSDVPQEMVDQEREIFSAQAEASGKPAEIVAKMIDGRIAKFVNEMSLEKQPFVKDPDTTVGSLLQKNNASVLSFTRFEVGEGIEKKQEDFAEEVMAQVRGDS